MTARGPVLIIPAKPLALAKTRLRATGVPAAGAFAVAFLLDTLTAALSTDEFAQVLVVTEDAEVRQVVEEEGGTAVVPPRSPAAGGHGAVAIGINAAVVYAAAWADERHGPGRRTVMVGDLPALRPADLTAALDEAREARRPALVTDAAGTGTTLLTADRTAALGPRFGALSARRHRELGHCPVLAPVPTLRQDVDVRDDLRAARRFGLGRRTAELVESLPGGPGSAMTVSSTPSGAVRSG